MTILTYISMHFVYGIITFYHLLGVENNFVSFLSRYKKINEYIDLFNSIQFETNASLV